MKAIIEADVPDYQIGQEVSIYFKDTMMIKGIVQEPSGDAISKQAVLDLIEHYKDMKEIAEIMKCDADAETKCKMISEIVNGIPHYFKEQEPKTIQEKQAESEKYQKAFDDGYENGYAQARFDYEQEPKTGHWIEKDGFDGDVYYDCSECGESWTTIEGTPWDNEWDYCPSCGARMVEPQESEG